MEIHEEPIREEPITEKQLGFLSSLLRSRDLLARLKPRLGPGVDYTLLDAERWMKVHLTKDDASTLISLFHGDSEKGFTLLAQKGIPTI